MPGFHWWMQNRLRSPEQGADTIEWLCSASAAIKLPSGSFFQGEWHRITSADWI